ncbi:hypothetical protein CFC21_047428 [Triticum aestivum]|uniref:Bidirectional sugar transporter SWEET n=2 Tax=Triticum aestivum TaxID=4565 RepID=A0A3B6GWX8_WHEAT|nr:hypothetical protein CFC21_047428 [Triticum aestivum]
MISPDVARDVVGNVISFGLFLSPVPTLWRIIKNKDVEEFKSDPYLATLLNCMLWVFYGILYVIFGSAMYASLLTIMISHIHLLQSPEIVHVSLYQSVLFVIFPCQLYEMITLKRKRDPICRFLLVGHVVQGKVIKNKSVEYMPFFLSLVSFLNGVCWTSYALIKFDLYVTIPNGLGALFSLVLYACYYRPTPKKEKSVKLKCD